MCVVIYICIYFGYLHFNCVIDRSNYILPLLNIHYINCIGRCSGKKLRHSKKEALVPRKKRHSCLQKKRHSCLEKRGTRASKKRGTTAKPRSSGLLSGPLMLNLSVAIKKEALVPPKKRQSCLQKKRHYC